MTQKRIARVRELQKMADERGQTMAQLAIAWVLRQPQMTSALIGASKVSQIEDAVGALSNTQLSEEELSRIETILG